MKKYIALTRNQLNLNNRDVVHRIDPRFVDGWFSKLPTAPTINAGIVSSGHVVVLGKDGMVVEYLDVPIHVDHSYVPTSNHFHLIRKSNRGGMEGEVVSNCSPLGLNLERNKSFACKFYD